jgi:GAF domain-containing protein
MGDRFEQLLDSLTEEVVVIDRNLRISYANPAWIRRVGMPTSQVLGKPCYQVLREATTPCAVEACAVQQAFKTGEPPQQPCTLYQERVDGEFYRISTSPVFDSPGKLAQVIHILHTTSAEIEDGLHATPSPEQRRQHRLADALRQVALLTTSGQGLRDTLDAILAQLARVIEYDSASICLVERRRWHIIASRGLPQRLEPDQLVLPPDDDKFARLEKTRQPIIIHDVRSDENWTPVSGTEYIRAWLSAPLLAQDRVIGTLNLEKAEPGFYQSEDAQLVMAFANQAAVVIENARLLEQERQRAAQLSLITDIGQHVLSILDPEALLDYAVQAIQRQFGYYYVDVFLTDSSEHYIVFQASSHLEYAAHWREQGMRFRLGEGITGYVAATGQPYVADDVRQDPRYIADELLTQSRSELAVPIRAGDRILGVLDLNSEQVHHFDDADLFVAQSLADQLALGLENARLYEAAQQRVAELEAVRQAGLSLTSSLELQGVLEAILEGTIKLLDDINDTHIFLYEDGRVVFGAAYWDGSRQDRPWAEPRPEGFTYTVARQGEPVVVPDMRTHPLFADVPQEWTGAMVGLPLKMGGRVVGVMSIAYKEPRTFEESELHILRLLADQAAIAIENARLFAAERQSRLELKSIQATATALSAELDLDTLLDRIVTEAANAFRTEAASLMLWDEDETSLIVQASCGLSEQYTRQQQVSKERAYAAIPSNGDVSPLYISELADAPLGNRDLIIKEGIRSVLTVPLLIQGRPIGALNIYSKEHPRTFSSSEIELAEIFASQAAVMIANAQLYRQTEHFANESARRAERLAVVNRVSLAVNSTLDLDEILQTAAREMAQVFNVRQTGVVLFDEDAQYGTVAAEFQETPDDSASAVRIPLTGNPSLERILATKQPLAILDAHHDPLTASIRDTVEARNIQSILIVPLIVKGTVIGTIGLDAIDAPRTFSHDEIDLAQTIANQAAAAIENARLFSAEARRRREAETLQTATQALSATIDLQAIFEVILSELRQVVPYDSASIQQLKGDRLEIIGGHGFPNIEDLLGVSFDITARDNPNREVVRTRSPLILDDAPTVYSEFKREPHAQAGIRSWLGVPLLFGDRLMGMLALDRQEPGAYTQEHARLALAFAAQAAIAIENARLFQETETRAREMAALASVGQAMTTLELDDVLDNIAEHALQTAQAEISSVYLLDDEQKRLTAKSVHGAQRNVLAQATFTLGEGTIGQVALTGQPLIVHDTTADTVFTAKTKASQQIHSCMTVPLAVKGRVIGTLEVCNKVGAEKFTEDDQRLLGAFAAQAAIAIENARLYQEVSRHLEEVQILNRVAMGVTSTLDFDEVIHRALAILLGTRNFERLNILLLDEAKGELWLHPALAGSDIFPKRADLRIPLGKGIVGQVARTGRPLRVNDVREDPSYIEGYPDTLSELCVPLRVGERIIGVLDVQSTRLGAYSESEERLLTTLAGQLSTIIENVRLFEESQQRVRELTALTQVSQALNEARDLNTILDIVLEEAFSLLECREGSIILIDPPGSNQLRIVAERGLGTAVVEAFNRRPVYTHEGTYKRALRTGRLVEVPDTSVDPDFLHDVGSRAGEITNVPLVTDRGALGLIAVDAVPRDETTRRLLMALADMAAVAIAKERLYLETADRLAEVSTLYTLSTQITGSLSQTSVLDSIVTILKLTLDCRACNIFLLEPGGEYLQLEASSGLGMTWEGTSRLKADQGISGRVLRERRSIYVPDAQQEFDLLFSDSAIRSLLIVPLIVRDRVIGTLSIDDVKANAFDNEGRLLTIAAAQAAVAIENAQLYESLQGSYTELEQAYDELRHLDKMKSEFVQNISHELRTPLTFIRGYVELLQDGDMGKLTAEQAGALGIVANKAEALSRLVDDIISLQQAGQASMRFEALSLTQLGHMAVQAAQASAADAGITLLDAIPDGLPNVMGDKRRLSQVIDNLLQNAIKFSDAGDTVTVRMSEEDTSIRIEVEDTGIGVPPDEQARIFERFYQVDGTTTRRFSGTGLGLAIVKQIVENHGGQVGVESVLGEGSLFYFTIPKADLDS